MTWKKVVNADSGTADKFGGNDLDRIADAFNGVDVSDPIIYNTDSNTLRSIIQTWQATSSKTMEPSLSECQEVQQIKF